MFMLLRVQVHPGILRESGFGGTAILPLRQAAEEARMSIKCAALDPGPVAILDDRKGYGVAVARACRALAVL